MSRKNFVTNTSELAQKYPELMLLAAMGASRPGEEIEHQEAAGQRELSRSEVLPVRMDFHWKPEHEITDREILERLGVVFHGPVEGDPIFQNVTFPPGMSLKPTNHSMWSDLVLNGDVVAQVFYKAEFYDRSAHMWCVGPPEPRSEP